MPSAQVIELHSRRPVLMRTYGAERVNAVFREIDAHLAALPFLQEEALARFADRRDLVTTSTSADRGQGCSSVVVSPSAALMNFLHLCRRAAKARGLTVYPAASPEPDLGEAVLRLMDEHGIDARLYDVARALGLPPVAHAHPMGQGQGPL